MDVDAFVATRAGAWERLGVLTDARARSGAECDELIAHYRQASRDLATLQAHGGDPAVRAALSVRLTTARGLLLRGRSGGATTVARFLTRWFPVAVYRAWPWWLSVAVVFVASAAGLGGWVANSAHARTVLGLPDSDALTSPGGRFESYYSEHPHAAFAAAVWSNNAWVAAGALFTGILLVPAAYMLTMNAVNVGISGGLMAHAGRVGVFFADILPHGMLELTAVFVAGGAGLKLGWTLIDPGPRSRAEALARQGRATVTIAVGLVGVLAVSGLIEGFVTPSGWPAPARIAVGAVAEMGFLGYVVCYGSRADALSDRRRAARARRRPGWRRERG